METDKSGMMMKELARHHLLHIVDHQICRDDIAGIQQIINRWTMMKTIDVIITTGGTGMAEKDVTIEAIRPLIDKEMSGFGELFRYISFVEDIGTHAMLSRAVAGKINQTIIFVLPGSLGAVRLAMNRLIIPELSHLLSEISKHD